MEFCFQYTWNTAKHVFNGTRQAGQGVCLHLANVDNTISGQNVPRDGELFDQAPFRKDTVSPVEKSARGMSKDSAASAIPALRAAAIGRWAAGESP